MSFTLSRLSPLHQNTKGAQHLQDWAETHTGVRVRYRLYTHILTIIDIRVRISHRVTL